ncbi:hypothetical protein [Micromonospora sp. DT62]|uniref:hypothetical protein n=1 Tax=Micromonospora sp. DT62 TaxID=3416521 RepID=UPI003CF545B0
MAWYLNRALSNFRNEVNSRWPNRDKTSDGTIGDKAHQNTNSDHNPDSDGSVDAWDMDVDGVDVWACISAAIAHEATQYIIYNRRITSRNKPGGLGAWHPYTGANPHDKHVHFNTRSSHENSTKGWFPEEDMPLDNTDVQKMWTWDLVNGPAKEEAYKVVLRAANSATAAVTEVRALGAKVDQIFATPPGSVTITDEQLERVLRKVIGSVDEV